MADGALRSDVLKVLGQEGVDVTPLPDSRYRLSRADVLITVRLQEVVSRTTAASLERHFGVAKAKFFPPTLKVVPIDRPRASGEQE